MDLGIVKFMSSVIDDIMTTSNLVLNIKLVFKYQYR